MRTLAGIFSERWRAPSTCQACGNNFSCGATLSGCWCSEVKLTEETRADLRTRFSGCLCRGCLEKFADGNQETQEIFSAKKQ
ncbi:MAG: cysteine-rich CWC family protein [Pyrinomonadaceae bacterium]